jgi:tetratricopeptide (TPR) repeat protein
MQNPATLSQQLYGEAVRRILAAQPGAAPRLHRASVADPSAPLPQAGLALLHHRAGRPVAAARRLERAAELASRATRRERSHVGALAAVIDGHPDRARRRVQAHLALYPRDALLVQEGAELFTWSAADDPRPARLSFLNGLAHHYAGDWWFPGDLAFDLAESGRPERAAALARRALTANPRHAGAVHSLAHTLFEAGDHAGGAAMLRDWLPTYSPLGAEHSHLTWHLALFELGRGQEAAAMAIYRQSLDPASSSGRRLWDSASFLWRRLLARPGRSLPWGSVRALAAGEADRPGSAFQDVHLAMAFAGAGDGAGMRRLLGRLRRQASAGDAAAGEVALPIAQSLDAFGQKDYAGAARRLEGAMAAVPRLGGSNAQRAVFGATLDEARRRAGRPN